MPATVELIGTRLFTVDSTTGVSIHKIAGSGGTPSAALADSAIEGSGAVTVTVNKTHIAMKYDLGAANTLDFTLGGANEGQAIGVWAQFLAAGILNTQANGGFGIYISSALNADWNEYYIHGSDTYGGKPLRLIIDPTNTASASAGTIDLSAVRYVGVFANVGGTTARFDNLILDAGDVYNGIRVYGTASASGIVADILADEVTNKRGIVVPLNDEGTAAEALGAIELGDSNGVNASTLTDVNAKLFLGAPRYYNGTSVVNAVSSDFFTINCVGNTTGSTSVTIGNKTGSGVTATGSNGWSLTGSQFYSWAVDFADANTDTSQWYGCTFQDISGGIQVSPDAAHEFISGNVIDSGQVTQNGGNITALSIGGALDAYAIAVDDLTKVNQLSVAGSSADAIDLTSYTATSISLTSILSSGSVGSDVVVSNAGDVDLNVSDDSSIGTASNVGAGNVSLITGIRAFSFAVNPAITDYEWRIYSVTAAGSLNGSAELAGEESATAASQTYNYSYTADVQIAVQIIESGVYVESVEYYTLKNTDQSVTINLRPETNQ